MIYPRSTLAALALVLGAARALLRAADRDVCARANDTDEPQPCWIDDRSHHHA